MFGPPTLTKNFSKCAKLLRQNIGVQAIADQTIELTFTQNSSNTLTMNALKEARLKAGLTQIELAEATGIKQPMISRIEKGKVVAHPDTKRRIEEKLGWVDWLSHERILISGSFIEAQTLVKKLLGIYLGMDHFEQQALKNYLWKYFRHTAKQTK